jgi:hypothetical protein
MASKTFESVDVLRDPDGVVAPVTMRIRDGRVELSFSLQKEFDKLGTVERTVWLKREHIAAAARLLEKLPGHLDLLEDQIRAERRQKR